MKAAREIKGMTGFADAGAAIEGLFNPAVRQANREIAEAQAKANAKLAKANAKVARKALKADTKEAIAAIKASAGKTVEAVVESKGFWQKVGSGLGSVFAWPFKASAKVGLWIVEQPVALALKPVKGLVNGIGGVFTKSPRTALAGTAILGAVAVGTAVSPQRKKPPSAGRGHAANAGSASDGGTAASASELYELSIAGGC